MVSLDESYVMFGTKDCIIPNNILILFRIMVIIYLLKKDLIALRDELYTYDGNLYSTAYLIETIEQLLREDQIRDFTPEDLKKLAAETWEQRKNKAREAGSKASGTFKEDWQWPR